MSEIFDSIQLLGGILLTIGYIPQIRKILKTRDVRSFDLSAFTIVALGIGCMEAYAVYQWFWLHAAGAFFVTNTLSFLIALIMLGLIIGLREKKDRRTTD